MKTRIWEVTIKDESGDHVEAGSFIGPWDKAEKWANEQADKWERESGGLCLKLTLHSMGVVECQA